MVPLPNVIVWKDFFGAATWPPHFYLNPSWFFRLITESDCLVQTGKTLKVRTLEDQQKKLVLILVLS